MTATEILRRIGARERAPTLREVAGSVKADVVEHARLSLLDLQDRGLVHFSGQTDRWYLTDAGRARLQSLGSGGQLPIPGVVSVPMEELPLTEQVVERLRRDGPATAKALRAEFKTRTMAGTLMSLRHRGLVTKSGDYWHAAHYG